MQAAELAAFAGLAGAKVQERQSDSQLQTVKTELASGRYGRWNSNQEEFHKVNSEKFIEWHQGQKCKIGVWPQLLQVTVKSAAVLSVGVSVASVDSKWVV